jgi:hypothetical protein
MRHAEEPDAVSTGSVRDGQVVEAAILLASFSLFSLFTFVIIFATCEAVELRQASRLDPDLGAPGDRRQEKLLLDNRRRGDIHQRLAPERRVEVHVLHRSTKTLPSSVRGQQEDEQQTTTRATV